MLREIIGLIVFTDGILTTAMGKGFLQRLRPHVPAFIRPVLDMFMQWPKPLLRVGAMMQAMAGWRMLT